MIKSMIIVNRIMLKSKAVLLVIVFTIGFASLSCKSPGDIPLQENTEIELIDTQEEEVLQEKEPFSTEELFLWKKHLGYRAGLSENAVLGGELYFHDPVLCVINKLNVSNGEIQFIGKDPSCEAGGIDFSLESSIIRMYASKEHEDSRVILDKVSLPDLVIQWQHTMDHPNYSALTLYEDMILYGSFSGYIYALDIEDGSLRWRFSFEDAVGKGFYPYYYEEDSKIPVNISYKLYIWDDILYCYYNGYRPNHRPDNKGLVYAIDLSTQKLLWKALLPDTIGGDIFYDPLPTAKKLYAKARKSLYEIDAQTGQFIEILLEELYYDNLVGLWGDYFVLIKSSPEVIHLVSKSDHSVVKRELPALRSFYESILRSGSPWRLGLPLYYRNVTQIGIQMVIDDQHYQHITHDVLILANSTLDLLMLDLNSGDIILHWINTNRTSEAWVDAFRHQDIFIAWDGFGIYALDLKKVFMRWLDTKETIEIVTGRE